jgi:hypothetical protein
MSSEATEPSLMIRTREQKAASCSGSVEKARTPIPFTAASRRSSNIFCRAARVHATGRIVEHQHPGLQRKPLSKDRLLLVAAAELPKKGFGCSWPHAEEADDPLDELELATRLQPEAREIGQENVFRNGETWNATRAQTVGGQDDHSGFDERPRIGTQGNGLSARAPQPTLTATGAPTSPFSPARPNKSAKGVLSSGLLDHNGVTHCPWHRPYTAPCAFT